MRDVTLRSFPETHGRAPRPRTAPHATVLVAEDDPTLRRLVHELAGELRRAGLRVALPLEARKLGKLLERASKDGTRVAVIVGTKERDSGVVTLRDLARGAQEEVPRAHLAVRVRAMIDQVEARP